MTIVTYREQDNIAVITMDDGKANAVSPTLVEQLNAALDQAQDQQQVVVLTGRAGKFSAGFDLSVMGQGPAVMAKLVASGARLAHRLLSFPMPVVIACNGHGLAMGAFLLLAGDYRIGAEGPYKIGLNEVAIGMTMPYFGVEIARGRLNLAHFHRAVINAEIYSPLSAVEAGYLDTVVSEEVLLPQALAVAAQLGKLNLSAHAATKLRTRQPMLDAIDAAIEKEFAPLTVSSA